MRSITIIAAMIVVVTLSLLGGCQEKPTRVTRPTQPVHPVRPTVAVNDVTSPPTPLPEPSVAQETVPVVEEKAVTPEEIIRQQEILLMWAQWGGPDHQWEAWQVQAVMNQQADLRRALDNASRAQWTALQLQQITQQQQAIQRSLEAAQHLQQDSFRLQTVMRQQQALQQALDAVGLQFNIVHTQPQLSGPSNLNPGAPGVGNPSFSPGAPGVGSPALLPGAPGVGNPSVPKMPGPGTGIPSLPGPSFGGPHLP